MRNIKQKIYKALICTLILVWYAFGSFAGKSEKYDCVFIDNCTHKDATNKGGGEEWIYRQS